MDFGLGETTPTVHYGSSETLLWLIQRFGASSLEGSASRRQGLERLSDGSPMGSGGLLVHTLQVLGPQGELLGMPEVPQGQLTGRAPPGPLGPGARRRVHLSLTIVDEGSSLLSTDFSPMGTRPAGDTRLQLGGHRGTRGGYGQ